ncbi:4'-phosphopantetheinyl transferase family protein [Streptomyces nanhaiensis]|uniref:4'-phosphopantetheinyl transferase family protein n=1 Tax=Streptomyces nanhaiensis TaxID=679319 RepID=UPI00399CD0A8
MTVSRVEVWLAVPVGDQRRHAHALVLRAAAALLGVEAGALALARERGGRPYVALSRGGPAPLPAPLVSVSVSHTRGLTAVAVCGGGEAGGRIGVDVEAVRGLPAVALARRWFSDEEAQWIESHDAALRVRALLWVWTHKEALGKALGTGLVRGGLLLPVPLPASGVPEQRTGDSAVLREIAPEAGLTSAVPPAPDGYALCVAGARGTGGLPVSVRRVDG